MFSPERRFTVRRARPRAPPPSDTHGAFSRRRAISIFQIPHPRAHYLHFPIRGRAAARFAMGRLILQLNRYDIRRAQRVTRAAFRTRRLAAALLCSQLFRKRGLFRGPEKARPTRRTADARIRFCGFFPELVRARNCYYIIWVKYLHFELSRRGRADFRY